VFETSGFQGVTGGNGQLGLDFLSVAPQSWKLKLLGKSEPKMASLSNIVVQNGDLPPNKNKPKQQRTTSQNHRLICVLGID